MSTRPAPLLLRGGTSPDDVAVLRAALAPLLHLGGATTSAPHPPLVPISPQEDESRVLADLERRLDPDGPASLADLLLRTSGSTTGTGSLIAMRATALAASARATHDRLSGPGTWVLALPAHHVAGLQILVRSLVAGTEPVVVDTTSGFTTAALTAGLTRALAASSGPVYLSLVPTQLLRALADPACVHLLARTSAVLLGGAAAVPSLLDRARSAGIPVITTYGMSETGGGCVYDGVPLDGVTATIEDPDADGAGRIALAGPVLALGYAHRAAPAPPEPGAPASSRFITRDGSPLLLTSDRGRLGADGRLMVLGRLDDVIITGGIKVDPRESGRPASSAFPTPSGGAPWRLPSSPRPPRAPGWTPRPCARPPAPLSRGPRPLSASWSCPSCPCAAPANPTAGPCGIFSGGSRSSRRAGLPLAPRDALPMERAPPRRYAGPRWSERGAR